MDRIVSPMTRVQGLERVEAAVPRAREVVLDAERLRRSRIQRPGETSAAAMAFKVLRTQVLQRVRRLGFRSVAVVSADSEAARTVASINLAIAVAGDPDHTALLVDADLRRPFVHECLGIESRLGLVDCLEGRADVGDALVRPQGYPGLAILPGRGAADEASELLASDRARQLTAELARRYANRLVIYDVPALLGSDDALAFLPRVDAALLVAAEGRTRREHVLRAMDLIRDTPVLGTVLVDSREAARG